VKSDGSRVADGKGVLDVREALAKARERKNYM